MHAVLTAFAAVVMPILTIALVVLINRHTHRTWRAKIDAELQSALNDLGAGGYTLVVDKLTSPSTDRTANVYRILHDEQDHYFLFMKIGEHPGLLKPLSKERALLAAKMNG
ncbi:MULTISPECIES: hypothetical protein [unclassified Pseudomonas]|uniref:hypothetical protein n=1 Tax=unclassified Pseudomonas TaxID=196821 RepID=UPI000BC4D371|nr:MULTISPECIES: hypothetical protein [unclassified Pseudomonas]PVZ20177.1 hypothetical protein F474_00770 [Pseudomonas sp. URIL14HWK12:I12]PVZ27243.1 hypothetical protein F470_00425 [Pseudomonas sp. URIL14HWK12:I10]PVZ38132.1 hypothetical protein F472_00770 [Pseudomonas sp. URIL14HWK12:I11]SNZ04464.1 hypothetical protein SAMN05660463_00634 [Pseudomonas sp. URIL14HWK12:I9]